MSQSKTPSLIGSFPRELVGQIVKEALISLEPYERQHFRALTLTLVSKTMRDLAEQVDGHFGYVRMHSKGGSGSYELWKSTTKAKGIRELALQPFTCELSANSTTDDLEQSLKQRGSHLGILAARLEGVIAINVFSPAFPASPVRKESRYDVMGYLLCQEEVMRLFSRAKTLRVQNLANANQERGFAKLPRHLLHRILMSSPLLTDVVCHCGIYLTGRDDSLQIQDAVLQNLSVPSPLYLDRYPGRMMVNLSLTDYVMDSWDTSNHPWLKFVKTLSIEKEVLFGIMPPLNDDGQHWPLVEVISTRCSKYGMPVETRMWLEKFPNLHTLHLGNLVRTEAMFGYTPDGDYYDTGDEPPDEMQEEWISDDEERAAHEAERRALENMVAPLKARLWVPTFFDCLPKCIKTLSMNHLEDVYYEGEEADIENMCEKHHINFFWSQPGKWQCDPLPAGLAALSSD